MHDGQRIIQAMLLTKFPHLMILKYYLYKQKEWPNWINQVLTLMVAIWFKISKRSLDWRMNWKNVNEKCKNCKLVSLFLQMN